MKRRELLKASLVLPFAGMLKAAPTKTTVDFVNVPGGVPVRKGMKYPSESWIIRPTGDQDDTQKVQRKNG